MAHALFYGWSSCTGDKSNHHQHILFLAFDILTSYDDDDIVTNNPSDLWSFLFIPLNIAYMLSEAYHQACSANCHHL